MGIFSRPRGYTWEGGRVPDGGPFDSGSRARNRQNASRDIWLRSPGAPVLWSPTMRTLDSGRPSPYHGWMHDRPMAGLDWKPWARRHPLSGSSGENVRRRAPRCQQPIGPPTVNTCMHSCIKAWRGNGSPWRVHGMLAFGDECIHSLRAVDAKADSHTHACMHSWLERGVGTRACRDSTATPRGTTPASRMIALMHGCDVYACAPRLTGNTEAAG